MNKPIYITTTIPYVNADPHIGFALELVQADTFARFLRREGRDVFFSTGTDEHGQKIWQKAKEEGRDVQEYVNFYAERFAALRDTLNLSYDNFIRTTDEDHIKAAQEMWKRADEAGDIYKKAYSGLYCVGCERFVLEKDLIDGKCPDHPTQTPERIEEENYFFKFSRYGQILKDYLASGDVVIPEKRKNEINLLVEEGLEDLSISRSRERMPWGISVPGDDEHVMYVWFEALVNYISTLGWPDDPDGLFERFWEEGETVQFAGKDQTRFQSLIWQAILASVGFSPTTKVFYHGFINSGGHKMSKSIGNVVDPLKIVEEHGTDALRYYLLRHIHPTEDSDFTDEKFLAAYNGGLANGIGNLLSRTIKMASSYGVEVAYADEDEVWGDSEFEEYKKALQEFRFNEALDWLWEGVNGLDELIAREEPFKLIKSDKEEDQEKAREVVGYALIKLWDIAILLEPALPETSEKIKDALQKREITEPLFVRK